MLMPVNLASDNHRMRILFVTSAPFLSEPLGSMLLAGICRSEGHEVGLTTLQTADVVPAVSRFRPEVIAYSTMSSELPAFARADEGLRVWMSRTGRQVYRIMGGPHATF